MQFSMRLRNGRQHQAIDVYVHTFKQYYRNERTHLLHAASGTCSMVFELLLLNVVI